MIEDVREWVVLPREVGAAQGDRDDLRTAGFKGVSHGRVGGELACPEQESGGESAAGDDEWVLR